MKSIKIFILLNFFIFNLHALQIGNRVRVIEKPINTLNCEIIHLIGKTGEIVCDCGEVYYDGWTRVCIYCVKIEEKNYRITSSNLEEIVCCSTPF